MRSRLPEQWMRTFSVSSRGLPSVEVQAPNWIVALGLAVRQLGREADVERLACEALPNGTVIVREIGSGLGFVVAEQQGGSAEPPAPVLLAAAEDVVEKTGLESRLQVIAQARTRAAACQTALKLAQELVPAESGAVIVKEKGVLRFYAATGPHAQQLVGLRLPLGAGVVGFSMEQRRTLVLDDASEDGRHCRDVDALTGYRTRTLACVPIVGQDECHGAIEVLNLPEGQTFTRTIVHQLQAVGQALGERLGALAADDGES